ncbi:MAG: ThuA domain-containing protein [Cellulomonadaceae bacterium]|jgi:type 1 glutamine amidotransferase|nr:ThuA domain-containing protein [Cellulomonadaceae bacterium]
MFGGSRDTATSVLDPHLDLDRRHKPHTLILTGRGRYEDLWHDHAATSHRIATTLDGYISPAGAGVDVRSTVPGALDDLDSINLLVLNISRPTPGYVGGPDGDLDLSFDGGTADLVDRIVAWARTGGNILATHATAMAAETYPALQAVIGGNWVEGVSGHPPIGDMTMTVATDAHPVTARQSDVETFDERYCRLAVNDDVTVLGWIRDDDGSEYPTLWVNESHGGRTVYSALGHSARAFDASTHRHLLRRAAAWLLT